jgi:outer membrane protein assembly factor BamE (lipoprotein component of BamABCDE complex)
MRQCLVAILTMCLAGCATLSRPAGRDFPQGAFSTFVLDRTSVQDAEALLGPPMKQTIMRGLANGKSRLIPRGTPFSLTVLIYYFAPNGFGQPAPSHPAKAASAVFFDGRLVAYATDNAIPGQANAPIDETRLTALRQGETTREQAIALLGTPNGQLLHLLDAQHGATELTYTWLDNDGETVQRRTLQVLFDSAGALTTYNLLDNAYPAGSQPIPLPQPQPPRQFMPGPEPLVPQGDREHT